MLIVLCVAPSSVGHHAVVLRRMEVSSTTNGNLRLPSSPQTFWYVGSPPMLPTTDVGVGYRVPASPSASLSPSRSSHRFLHSAHCPALQNYLPRSYQMNSSRRQSGSECRPCFNSWALRWLCKPSATAPSVWCVHSDGSHAADWVLYYDLGYDASLRQLR